MVRIIYGGKLFSQVVNVLNKDLLNFEPPFRKCWLHPCTSTHIRTYIHMYMYTYTYIYTHVHTHTYTYQMFLICLGMFLYAVMLYHIPVVGYNHKSNTYICTKHVHLWYDYAKIRTNQIILLIIIINTVCPLLWSSCR